jgi:uncharacterized membrane protein YkoI
MKTPPRLLKFCLAFLLVATASVQAGEGTTPSMARGGSRSGHIALAEGGISLQQAKSMAERRFKAKVISEETRQEGDRKIYILRLLNDKESWIVRVDAATGSMSSSSR